MDLWAPRYFSQSNSLVSSTGWHDPDARQLLVLRTMMTKNEKGLCPEVGKGEDAEDKRAGLWLTPMLLRSGQEMSNLFSKENYFSQGCL